MQKRVGIILGLFLVFCSLIWRVFISPGFLLQQPEDYSIDLIHDEDNRFQIGGSWSGNTFSLGRLTYTTEKVTAQEYTVKTDFSLISITGETLFDLNQTFVVDRKTHLNLSGDKNIRGGTYYNFPSHVKKDNYLWWPPTFGQPVNIRFVGEVTRNGLTLYHFTGQEEKIDDTTGYEFLPLVPETYRALSRAIIDVYVEPSTGLIVNYQDKGTSYYADKQGNRIWDIANWGNRYDDETITTKSKEAGSRLFYQNLLETGVSLLLFFTGAIVILLSFRKQPS